ncbi:MAG TPA: M56 family metallopeptidase, partial [Gemmatimonadaceae bacterium]|nr:M56 family metallopeptidase [Gemmatimonadaceae bacterium]
MSPHTMTPLTPFATDVLLRVTLVLAVFGAAGYALRNQTAALRHLVWSLAIVGCVAVPIISAVNPFTLALLPVRSSSVSPTPDVQRIDRFASEPAQTNARAEASAMNARADGAREVPAPLTTTAETTPSRNVPWTTLLLIAWLVGTLTFMLRYLAGLAAIRRVVAAAVPAPVPWATQAAAIAERFGVKRTPRLLISDETEMPFAFGVTRPVIVLPELSSDWTDERRQAVLMHEVAHFSRGDITMNALSQLARALYWFHPLAWLAAHRLRVEGERASDDVVLRGGALPSDYAEHLLAIVRSFGRALPAPALAMARCSDFEGCLLAILEPRERGALSRARAFGVAALAVAVLLP